MNGASVPVLNEAAALSMQSAGAFGFMHAVAVWYFVSWNGFCCMNAISPSTYGTPRAVVPYWNAPFESGTNRVRMCKSSYSRPAVKRGLAAGEVAAARTRHMAAARSVGGGEGGGPGGRVRARLDTVLPETDTSVDSASLTSENHRTEPALSVLFALNHCDDSGNRPVNGFARPLGWLIWLPLLNRYVPTTRLYWSTSYSSFAIALMLPSFALTDGSPALKL